jgi:ATP-dependent helicase/nuclease subunit A
VSRANPEQLQAIEHQGGVLLKAGAGSGKTFVLVEHIQFLAQSWMTEFSANPMGTLEEYIRSKFSQVVMMTFTRKAAGEMNIRLTEKFMSLAEKDEKWAMVLEVLPSLTVTTIDGFCKSLITNGYFPYLSSEAKVIFETERLDQVIHLFDEWYETTADTLPADLREIVNREKAQLLRAISSIFNDPSLRLEWKKFNIANTDPSTLPALLTKSFELNNLGESLSRILNLDLPSESDRSAFEKNVALFANSGLPVVDSVEKLVLYEQLFLGIKTLRGESGKKKSPAHDEALEGLKELREWVRDWAPVIKDYQDHYQDKIKPWTQLCLEIFKFIDSKIDPNQGMTFGDVTYMVALGLESPEIRERIQKVYRYFIVDEFQDTSALQFKIISYLINNDYQRLFCVGDSKQAIYGFRGGELSVFQDCAVLVPAVKSLVNNYRSLPTVINFNNSLFDKVLPAGQGFEHLDPFTVEAESQNVPEGIDFSELGEIEVLKYALEIKEEGDDKLLVDEINRLEAHLMGKSIQRQRLEKPQEVCTILYRKLGPSAMLIQDLMKMGIGFTAQFKIDLLEDPVMGLFLVLLNRRFDKNPETRRTYPEFMLRNYLMLLDVPPIENAEVFTSFDQDVKFWGLFEAFKKFIFSLGMTNENGDINFKLIETLCKLYHQDPESIYVQLIQGHNPKASLEFRSGLHSEKVQIMTAHASKGLEFDTVYLAGIYTNGKENPDRDMFGDHPGSFYWYLDLAQRDKRKSPQYIFESELNRYKNFSESKRLFYVACTRAKKKLVWVQLENLKETAVPKNSWINGLNLWLNQSQDAAVLQTVKFSEIHLDAEELEATSNVHLPLFFHDHMGIFPKGKKAPKLAIAGELSVTRLNALVDCPRKFYFQNTLKLTPSSEVKIFPSPLEDLDEVQVVSSAERGTLIHSLIAQGLNENFVVPRSAFQGPHHASIDWALKELQKIQSSFEIQSEKPLKFPFFEFMVSGIPDLILYSKDGGTHEIWDFKTGQINQLNLSHYWIQLKVYAYALYQLRKVGEEEKVKLVLSFVDVQKNLVLEVSLKQITSELFELWQSQNQPWKINTEHCGQCPYGDICPR